MFSLIRVTCRDIASSNSPSIGQSPPTLSRPSILDQSPLAYFTQKSFYITRNVEHDFDFFKAQEGEKIIFRETFILVFIFMVFVFTISYGGLVLYLRWEGAWKRCHRGTSENLLLISFLFKERYFSVKRIPIILPILFPAYFQVIRTSTYNFIFS